MKPARSNSDATDTEDGFKWSSLIGNVGEAALFHGFFKRLSDAIFLAVFIIRRLKSMLKPTLRLVPSSIVLIQYTDRDQDPNRLFFVAVHCGGFVFYLSEQILRLLIKSRFQKASSELHASFHHF